MKRILVALALMTATTAFAQAPEVSRDPENGSKTLKGFISRAELVNDTAFAWYGQHLKGFKPDAAAVTALKSQKDSIHVLVFGGTWCDDTKTILPKVFATLDAAGLPENRLTLLGVDRQKKTLQNLSEAFGVTNVPTFIVLRNGREVGRIVEYGTMGMPEREIGKIVLPPATKSAKKK